MRKSLLTLPLFFLLFTHVKAEGLDDKINLKDFQAGLLKGYIFEQLAMIRDTTQLDSLRPNALLDEACLQHAEFLEDKKKITHYQDKKKYKDPRTRAQTAGADLPIVYEDMATVVISRSMYLPNSKEKIVISTYRELGDYLVQLWMQMPYNRKHLLSARGTDIGISFVTNDKTHKVYVVMNIGG